MDQDDLEQEMPLNDLIEEDSDDDHHEPPQEEEAGPARNEDGSFDGGVAVAPEADGPPKQPSECDLMLFLECMETFSDIAPNHTILQPGITVSVGLDKSTKLSAVFQRYCDYLNEQYPTTKIEVSDLDFVHCTVLNGNDTAETSALMKNDRVQVRKNSKDERDAEAEQHRLQRETDREYFRDMRLLLPDTIGSKTCDVLLDCRGKLLDEKGLNQEVLRTDVRGHSVLLSKRCKWLGDTIQNAREELERQSVVTLPDHESQVGDGAARPLVAASMPDEDDDDGIEALPYAPEHNEEEHNREAAEIEDDDDEDVKMAKPRQESLDMFSSAGSGNLLWVALPNHAPDAVRLLLEYCYTNRVVPLGQEAFLVACRTKGDRRKPFNGPVAPYHNHSSRTRGWPNNGLPIVSFAVALAGISLAEEAKMKRLSLMCEVAASQLVERSNVVEALSRCTTQEKLTGNPLARLRKAAMDVLLRNGQRGVVDICRTPTFRRALEEKSATIVPSLLVGTMEALNPEKGKSPTEGCKRELSQETQTTFEELDKEDTFHRDMERRKRRAERWGKPGGADGGFIHEDDWNFEIKKNSLLKRVPHHGIFSIGRSSPRQRNSRRRRGLEL